MKPTGILIHPLDQVITLTEGAKAGEAVCYTMDGSIHSQRAKEDIPQYHKMAIQEVKKGQMVRKYGEEIGRTTEDILPGAWVHVHNLQSACMMQDKGCREEKR